jgi:hypothetical protein
MLSRLVPHIIHASVHATCSTLPTLYCMPCQVLWHLRSHTYTPSFAASYYSALSAVLSLCAQNHWNSSMKRKVEIVFGADVANGTALLPIKPT